MDFSALFTSLQSTLGTQLPHILGAIGILVLGWVIAVPVPLLLIWAPSWGWIVVANLLLGISQGMTWSTTVVMKYHSPSKIFLFTDI